jgi:Glycosyl transferase family 2
VSPQVPGEAPGNEAAADGPPRLGPADEPTVATRVVLALVPARDEAERVGATVRALRDLPGVTEVLVVSDGSTDATAARALEAGAHCLDLPRNLGKGGALNAGLAALMGRVAERVSPEPAVLLLADADLAETAGRLGRLLDPVLDGEADLAIADLPAQHGAGGFGVAMGLARIGMARATGRRMSEPLSGQRAVRWEALPALLPFAPGFGVEVAMTIDALRAGLRVVEVEVDLRHNATGKDLSGLLHRARQARAIARELTRRKAWRPSPNGRGDGETRSAETPADARSSGSRETETPGDAGSPGSRGTEVPADAEGARTRGVETPGDAGSPGWEGSPGAREGDGGFPQPPPPQPPPLPPLPPQPPPTPPPPPRSSPDHPGPAGGIR